MAQIARQSSRRPAAKRGNGMGPVHRTDANGASFNGGPGRAATDLPGTRLQHPEVGKIPEEPRTADADRYPSAPKRIATLGRIS